jgi:hypothetical protein
MRKNGFIGESGKLSSLLHLPLKLRSSKTSEKQGKIADFSTSLVFLFSPTFYACLAVNDDDVSFLERKLKYPRKRGCGKRIQATQR